MTLAVLSAYVQYILVYCISDSLCQLILFLGPPDPPQNCDVHNHTTQGLSVTCSIGFGGGLEQTFHMEVRDRDSGYLLQNLSNIQPIFTIG